MKNLRHGFTTGSCAAAATKAAALMLLSKEALPSVKIVTPKKIELNLEVIDISIQKNCVSCAIIKDAGDDPDVTNGIKIYATVSKCESGIHISGGKGVGRVTKKGLEVAVGEAAINPVPLEMIKSELLLVKEKYAYEYGFQVVISVPEGEKVAEHTFNSRLGIIGGISILGTTGIVEPMSERAIIDTIKAEMNVIKASGEKNLIIAPGNYGIDFLKNCFAIDLDKAVKCSNFIGEAIDYACYLKFEKILLVGHVGKIVKLAGGIMNTHSKIADCRMEILAAHAAMAGAIDIHSIMEATTTEQAFQIICDEGLMKKVSKSLSEKIQFHLEYRIKNALEIEFISFSGNKVLLQSAKLLSTHYIKNC